MDPQPFLTYAILSSDSKDFSHVDHDESMDRGRQSAVTGNHVLCYGTHNVNTSIMVLLCFDGIIFVCATGYRWLSINKTWLTIFRKLEEKLHFNPFS